MIYFLILCIFTPVKKFKGQVLKVKNVFLDKMHFDFSDMVF